MANYSLIWGYHRGVDQDTSHFRYGSLSISKFLQTYFRTYCLHLQGIVRGGQIFQKSRSHFQILWNHKGDMKEVPYRELTNVRRHGKKKKIVVMVVWRPGFLHPWFRYSKNTKAEPEDGGCKILRSAGNYQSTWKRILADLKLQFISSLEHVNLTFLYHAYIISTKQYLYLKSFPSSELTPFVSASRTTRVVTDTLNKRHIIFNKTHLFINHNLLCCYIWSLCPLHTHRSIL